MFMSMPLECERTIERAIRTVGLSLGVVPCVVEVIFEPLSKRIGNLMEANEFFDSAGIE